MNRFLEEDGQGMVEYALIIALIAVVCIGAFAAMGKMINDKADAVNTELDKTGTNKSAGGSGAQGGNGN